MNTEFKISVKGAVVSDHKVLLLRKRKSGKWELPGGTVEHGESLVNALKREFEEETGIDSIHILQPVGNWEKISQEDDYAEHRMVIMYQVHPDSFDITLSDEHDEYQWVDYETLEMLEINSHYVTYLKRLVSSSTPMKNQAAIAKLVVGGIIRYQDEYLLLQRSPYDHSFQLQWQFVVGGVEVGQTLEMALSREIEEETGIDISELNPMFLQSFLFGSEIPGEIRRLMSVFVIDLDTRPEITLSDEHVQFEWVKVDDLAAFDTVLADGENGTNTLIRKAESMRK